MRCVDQLTSCQLLQWLYFSLGSTILMMGINSRECHPLVLVSTIIYPLLCHEYSVVRMIVFDANAMQIRRRFEGSLCF
jgi:hypothetical protein